MKIKCFDCGNYYDDSKIFVNTYSTYYSPAWEPICENCRDKRIRKSKLIGSERNPIKRFLKSLGDIE